MPTRWLEQGKTYAGRRSGSQPETVTWALESNFGASQLALQHLNFAGLKFRARMNRGRPWVRNAVPACVRTRRCHTSTLRALGKTLLWAFMFNAEQVTAKGVSVSSKCPGSVQDK